MPAIKIMMRNVGEDTLK